MITIYCDFHQILHIKRTATVIVVSKLQDYIPLRQNLRSMLDIEDSHYSVYVQSYILAQWLKDLRDYEPSIIKWIEINLHTHFEEQFGFPPPRELDEIALQDLLQTLSPMRETTIEDPIGWILSQCIDPLWGYTHLNTNHLADLAAWAIKTQQIPTSLLPIMKTRLAEWSEHNPLYQMYLEMIWKKGMSWKNAAEKFLLRWALQSYPTTFNLRQQLETVPLVDCSQYIPICLELLRNHNKLLRQFWYTWLESRDSEYISSLLQWSSGLSVVELETVERWAKSHQEQLTKHHLGQIKEHFSHLPNTEKVLKRLERLVPPPLPEEPQPLWSVEKWLDWTADQYMPYFAWIIHNNQPRQLQMDLAARFENWLVDEYPKLLLDFKAPFSSHQWGRIKELFDTDKVDVILWFIVDGLTWWQGTRLTDFCADLDIGGIYTQPTISVLPTITSISKKALVQGSLDSFDVTQPIAQILKTHSVRGMNQVHVYTQDNEMEQALSSTLLPGLYALLYNGLDHHAHDVQGFTDNESIDGHLKLIARLVKDGFDRCLEQGLRVKAFIGSDHGSTLLPEKATVLKVPPFAYILDDDDVIRESEDLQGERKKVLRRTRACATDKVPDNYDLQSIKKDWYYLEKDTFVLPKQFFLPKGYQAVERRPRGWTHGGATPEEVVVPSLELQPVKIELVTPKLEIHGNLFPHKVNRLQVIVKNFNAFPIRILQLVATNSTVKLPDIVPANSSVEGEIKVLSIISKKNIETIEWSFVCEGGGTHDSFRGYQDVAVRHMQVSQVDEMFEDML